ncbi:unnamed protein product [Parascedosporium putredinis]|uniref:Carboxylic ester hydrolase n=1 Tax=Parascedosporium putredinis TaxID=1442378 RepID=A0A9P1ME73_9PEZI|nr:unnamed protein product [Parascedosporium putredinis]CAI8005033.1 unnamed protein product [Parascedosporium putredinis]
MALYALLAALATSSTALAASLQQITSFGDNPTNIQMFEYVPDKLAEAPAVVVNLHPCGGSAAMWFRGTKMPTYADELGFVLIYPGTTNMNNCWDVHSPESLTHGKGGDALAIVNMVDYALKTHGGDPQRVYVMGSSSGAMMTNVLAGSYPDVFEAGSAYSGTAHACFAGAPSATPMSPNQTCAQGLSHTPEEWASFVHNSYPDYDGPRPRMQIFHGNADALVRPACAVEALKQWSAVLGETNTQNVTGVPSSAYTQLIYGDGSKLMGFFGAGVGHTAPVNEELTLRFFGLLE